MATKKNKSPQVQPAKTEDIAQPAAPVQQPRQPLSIFDFKVQAIIVGLLAFIFYINTYNNEVAHDDGIVIVKNEFVLEGFAGLPGIFTKDAYASYYRQLNTVNQLSGGRYRPLAIATFAIEQQFFGAVKEEHVDSVLKQSISYGIRGPAEQKMIRNAHIRHLFNVLWYVACVVVLLYFLRYIIFPKQPLMALVAAILFTIHPIHTEVVANIKSRDEIMSLLFMCLTMILAFKYEEHRKLQWLGGAMACFFLAFLSKEYAITLVLILPVLFYLFRGYTVKRSIIAMLPYLIVVFFYFVLRVQVAIGDTDQTFRDFLDAMKEGNKNSEKEVLNNPYYFATGVEKLATEIATSLNYLKLLIFPHPLSADYSYNTIPYKNFSHPLVWLSLLVHGAIIAVGAFFMFVRKEYKVIGFACLFYMLHLLLVNNIIFNIGATMGERLIFHSSVGFSIVLAWLLVKGIEKIKDPKVSYGVLLGVLVPVTALAGIKTIDRNADWKNDRSLFFEDIKVVPNSVLVNGNVAAAYITMADYEKTDSMRKKYLHKGIDLLSKAISIHPTFVAGYLNQGIAFYKLGMLDSAEAKLDSVKKFYPNYPTLGTLFALLADNHMKIGWNKYGQYKLYPQAIEEFKKGVKLDSNNAELWYNLGGAYYSNRQPREALDAWQQVLRIKPDHQQARLGMQAASEMMRALGGGGAPQQQQVQQATPPKKK